MSLLLALLIHACVFLALRWEALALPARELLVRIVHVAGDRDGASEPPEPAPAAKSEPLRPPPVPRAAVKKPTRESVPRPQPSPAPAAEGVQSSASPATPGAGERESAVGSARAPAAGSSVSAQPHYKTNPEPEYPAAARRRGQQGTVLLTVRVDVLGRAERVVIHTSSGVPALDAAAIAAVKLWEFEPARLAGLPVASEVEVPIRFQLDAAAD